MTTLAAALSRLTVAMIEVHERVCDIEPPHRWESCSSTPGLYATADALDVIDAGDDLRTVALAMHDRECQEASCHAGTADRETHAIRSWGDQAEAMIEHARVIAETVLPDPSSRRGDLLAVCQCGHVRRNHSVYGDRCYATPCTCQPDGGFRPA